MTDNIATSNCQIEHVRAHRAPPRQLEPFLLSYISQTKILIYLSIKLDRIGIFSSPPCTLRMVHNNDRAYVCAAASPVQVEVDSCTATVKLNTCERVHCLPHRQLEPNYFAIFQQTKIHIYLSMKLDRIRTLHSPHTLCVWVS